MAQGEKKLTQQLIFPISQTCLDMGLTQVKISMNKLIDQNTSPKGMPSISYLEQFTTAEACKGDTTSRKIDFINQIREIENQDDRKWYMCDDTWVNQIEEPDTSSASAYLLFYVMLS